MSAKSEAEGYFKRRNDYWKFEESRKKPVIKSPIREMRDTAAAECRLLGIHGAKDYSCKTLVKILLDESSATEDVAINLLSSWYLGKFVCEEEYARNKAKKAKKAERTNRELDRAAKQQKQCNPSAKKQKRRSGHILRARTVPDGDSYKVIDIVYR